MTKGTARAMVRRRLNERAADGWDDLEINELVREALKLVQKWVVKVDAFAFMAIAYVDTIAGTAGEFYALPGDFWYEFEIGYKATGSSSYTRLERDGYETIREFSSDATAKYARRGGYLALWPNPSAAVTAGLRIQYMPTLTTGDDADPDNDDIRLPLHDALHMAVVVWAVMLALGDTQESKSELAGELRMLLEDMPEWYHRGGTPQQVRLSLNRDA